MLKYIPAYDVESQKHCLKACSKIVQIHLKQKIPATFFIVGRLIEKEGKEYKKIFKDTPFFEIASHTYSHKLIKDHPFGGPAVSKREIKEEIYKSKKIIEDFFNQRCYGLRPGFCFEEGLKGEKWILEQIHKAGYKYTSSKGWGPFYTLPAPLTQRFNYRDDGFADLWEFPGHGWHENVLKGHNAVPSRLLLWPPLYPEIHISRFIKTPEEEFKINRFFIEKAIKEKLEYISLIWHPWSLDRFDPEMKMLEMFFSYLKEKHIKFSCFKDLL